MKKFIYISIITLSAFLLGAQRLNAQQLALETDGLMLACMAPNIGLELVTGEKTSLAINALGAYKPYGFDMKGFAVRPEFKFWLAGRPMIREYLGVMGVITSYEMVFDGKIRDGKAMGLGVSGGYSFKLAEKFCLELSAGVGLLYYSQRLYPEGTKYEDLFPGDEPVKDNSRGYSIVPMKLGVTLVWLMR